MIGSFSPESANATNGIFTYMSSIDHSNITSLVSVYANSFQSGFVPLNILDMQSTGIWRSSIYIENDSVTVHLIYHSLLIKNYSIRQYGEDHRVRQWIFEGSNDNTSWHFLDSQGPHDALCYPNMIFTFPTYQSIYSFFRIKQLGNNCGNDFRMRLRGLELFGNLFIKSWEIPISYYTIIIGVHFSQLFYLLISL